jgi:hypothetical protein
MGRLGVCAWGCVLGFIFMRLVLCFLAECLHRTGDMWYASLAQRVAGYVGETFFNMQHSLSCSTLPGSRCARCCLS